MALNVLATGIEFTPQGGSSVNLLDDYEEGTWTPGITFGTNFVSGAFLSTYGTYTKVGRFATADSISTMSAAGSSTGTAALSGLPFTSATGQLRISGIFTYMNAFVACNSIPILYGQSGSTSADLIVSSSAGSTIIATTSLSQSNFGNNTSWRAVVYYQTA